MNELYYASIRPLQLLFIAATTFVFVPAFWLSLTRRAISVSLVWATIGVGTGCVSLGIAYGWLRNPLSVFFGHAPPQEQPWLQVYGSHGAEIEAVRLVLLMIVAIRMLRVQFFKDCRALFRRRLCPGWWAVRLGVLVFAVSVCIGVFSYHLDPSAAPLTLFVKDAQLRLRECETKERVPDWAERSCSSLKKSADASKLSDVRDAIRREPAERFARYCMAPYQWYLPYSIICFLAVSVPLFGVPLAAASRDVIRLMKRRDRLRDDLHADATRRAAFLRFEAFCQRLCAKYIELPIWVLILLAYEFAIGKSTLADPAARLSLLVAGGMVSLAIIVAFVAFLYESAYARLLRAYPDDEPKPAWVQRRGPRAFLKQVSDNTVLAVVSLIAGSSLLLAVLWQVVEYLHVYLSR